MTSKLKPTCKNDRQKEVTMNLGTFSMSLTVKNLAAAQEFYETIGFTAFDGDESTWVMLRNDSAKIGLFQEMIETNIITFNPPDARAVETAIVAAGYEPTVNTKGDNGPSHFVVVDPDGNTVMFDQPERSGSRCLLPRNPPRPGSRDRLPMLRSGIVKAAPEVAHIDDNGRLKARSLSGWEDRSWVRGACVPLDHRWAWCVGSVAVPDLV